MSDHVVTQRLSGSVALITGGGGEIGSAIARRFASEGAAVMLGDLAPAKAEAVASELRDAGGRAEATILDVANEESCAAAVARTVERLGSLSALINVAAAATQDGTAENLPVERWQQAFDTNLTGVFLMCRYAIPAMRANGGGNVVNIASQLGHIGVAGRAAYATSKAALLFYTKALAMDHAVDRIRVNSVSPGFILTDRSSARAGSREAAAAISGPRHLLGRPGSPEEVAAAVAFMASSDASFVTGTDLLVDGGYVAFKGRLGQDGVPVLP